jgi:hypothetical protein
MNDLARRLLTSQTRGQDNSQELAQATDGICRQLRRQLARLLGHEGSDALFSRSLKIAENKFSLPPSAKATSSADCLQGFLKSVQDHEPAAAREMCVGVIESLLTLLASLVGEELTRTLVQDAFVDSAGAKDTSEGTRA